MNSLQILENKANKLILDAPSLSSATEALKLLNWTPLGIRRHKHCCIFIFKCINGLIDFNFKLTTNNSIHTIVITQEQAKSYIYQKPTQTGRTRTNLPSLKDFNNLNNTIKNTDSLPKFKTFLQKLTVKICTERN